MQNTRAHFESRTREAYAASACVGVFSASNDWDAALGFEPGRDVLDVRFDDTVGICFRTRSSEEPRDSRSRLRDAAGVLCDLGVERIVVLCSGQGVRGSAGTLFVVEDHINRSGDNPLIGMRHSERGERFVDMTSAYDPILCNALERAGCEAGLPVRRGVAIDDCGDRRATDTGVDNSMLRVSGLAAPVILARQIGVRVGAVACLQGVLGPSDATLPGDGGFGIQVLCDFFRIFMSSVEVRSGV